MPREPSTSWATSPARAKSRNARTGGPRGWEERARAAALGHRCPAGGRGPRPIGVGDQRRAGDDTRPSRHAGDRRAPGPPGAPPSRTRARSSHGAVTAGHRDGGAVCERTQDSPPAVPADGSRDRRGSAVGTGWAGPGWVGRGLGRLRGWAGGAGRAGPGWRGRPGRAGHGRWRRGHLHGGAGLRSARPRRVRAGSRRPRRRGPRGPPPAVRRARPDRRARPVRRRPSRPAAVAPGAPGAVAAVVRRRRWSPGTIPHEQDADHEPDDAGDDHGGRAARPGRRPRAAPRPLPAGRRARGVRGVASCRRGGRRVPAGEPEWVSVRSCPRRWAPRLNRP